MAPSPSSTVFKLRVTNFNLRLGEEPAPYLLRGGFGKTKFNEKQLFTVPNSEEVFIFTNFNYHSYLKNYFFIENRPVFLSKFIVSLGNSASKLPASMSLQGWLQTTEVSVITIIVSLS